MVESRAPGASSTCSSTRQTISFNIPKNSTLTRIDTRSLTDGRRGTGGTWLGERQVKSQRSKVKCQKCGGGRALRVFNFNSSPLIMRGKPNAERATRTFNRPERSLQLECVLF